MMSEENRKAGGAADGAVSSEKKSGSAQPHRRRVHYSGRYPKRFEEKYKEQDPEKYQDEIEHVISKGNTPAGMHIPIMVKETLDILDIRPGMKGLDCTLGYGGHSSAMLEKLEGRGHLCSLDADPIEIVKTEKRMREKGFCEDIFTPIHTNFRNIDQVAAQYGPFDFVMADLGVSSMQIDTPSRGFSWKYDAPLDLRFDPEHGVPASERLKELDVYELEDMFRENSDEPYAAEIARAIAQAFRKKQELSTTFELRNLIRDTILAQKEIRKLSAAGQKEAVKKSDARIFQALRIDVNSEFEVLYEFLEKLPGVLAPGGKAVVLTFHSGEDRLVKKAFRQGQKAGLYEAVSDDVIRPSAEECRRNPRAHSTKLRWAKKA